MEVNEIEIFARRMEDLGFPGFLLKHHVDFMRRQRMEKLKPEDSYVRYFGTDRMSYDLKLHFDLKKEQPKLKAYCATLRHLPPMVHLVYNGIDTKELSRSMDIYADSDIRKDIPELLNAFDCLEQGNNEKAKFAADWLKVKQWADTHIESYIDISAAIKRFERSHIFWIKGSASDIKVKDAYNLLSGRFVLKVNDLTSNWISLAASRTDPLKLVEKQYRPFDLNAQWHTLQFAETKTEDQRHAMISSLEQGDLVTTSVISKGKAETVILAVDANIGRIVTYQENHPEISSGNKIIKTRSKKSSKGRYHERFSR